MSGVHHPRGTSASRQTEHTEHSTAHGRQAQHGSHGIGRFGNYMFRIGRAPTQAGARRPQPLRPRPSPQQAQSAGEEMHVDTDLMQRLGSSDMDDDERRRPPPIDETGQKGAEQRNNHPPAPPPSRLKVRLPPAKAPTQPLAARLQLAGWPGADVLFSDAPQRPSAQQLVLALVAALLAAARPAATRPAAAGSGTILGMALMSAFLRKGTSAQDLSTLEKVKNHAMAARAAQPPRPRDLPLTEEERSANVLAPLKCLIMALPRTEKQGGRSIARLEMLSRSPILQGTRK